MKSIQQQIHDLRHWASMAQLTADKLSCLSPAQLREIADALEGLNADRMKVRVYETIYGPLRTCPGEDSIYPAGQHTHGCRTFYCLAGHHHIGEYMFGPDQINSHSHSLTVSVTGGENDA